MLSMSKAIVCKLLQRQTYDILSQKYSFLIFCLCVIGLLISAFRFGEHFLQWSKDKGYFSIYWDNLMEKSYQNNLCQYLPIDVVYTWVNGSDPELLYNLGKVKYEYERQINISRFGRDVTEDSTSCPFSHCIESHFILLRPLLSKTFTVDDLNAISVFKNAKDIFPVHSLNPNEQHLSATVVAFDTKEIAVKIVKKSHVFISGVNYTIHPALLTSEWTAPFSVFLQDIVILTGVHEKLNEQKLLSKLPIGLQQYITKVYLYPDKSLALLKVNGKASQDAVLQMEGNFTIDKKQTSMSAANLLLYIGQGIVSEDISESRFQDNEELRYSLRSVEKFAPWVRHIFIVTNGQIPSWLNLENPRVTIVTHEELYPNKSHLPTFSSPSIETHLHRIPNLSKKFLYLNDDVVFGKEIWPDDFYTHSKGYKVYLSWSVPDCREGCPATWIDDGYCDKPCNNSDCQWDGGDCKDGATGMIFNNDNSNIQMWREESDKLYCSVNCANTWLADRYCDQACNLLQCGFDAGDCGLDNYDKLFRLYLDDKIKHYVIPPGIQHAYFNLSSFLNTERTISDGNYEDNKGVRISSINQKFKVLTLILFSNHSESIQLSVKGIKDNLEYQFDFNVSVNTFKNENAQSSFTTTTEKPEIQSSAITKRIETTSVSTTTTVKIEIFDEKIRYPKINRESMRNVDVDHLNASNIDLPADIQSKLTKIEDLYKDGYLTENGYRRRKYDVLNEYLRVKNNVSIEKNTHTSRHLNSLSISPENFPIGSFPWEKKHFQKYEIPVDDYTTFKGGQRKLMDTFGDSLRHVNRLLNREFGFETRKVPAHMPHFVDVNLITDLQSRFAEEFDMTSSHKIRSREDMQFAFSFFYFVMSDIEVFDIEKLFNNYDTDNSGTWSDREIRTLLTQIYDLPLTKENVQTIDAIILNCSQGFQSQLPTIQAPPFERYLNSKLPVVSSQLVKNCGPLIKLIESKMKPKKKYKFEIVGEEEIAFKMIRNNVSIVIGQLDDIRKKPRKFICLNDDIDHRKPESKVVKSILIDFYESFYPIPSQFELPREFKNRFLTVKELKVWREERDVLKQITYLALFLLIMLILSVIFHTKISKLCRRFKLPRRKLQKIVKRFHDV